MPVASKEFIDAIREVVDTTVRKHKRKISGAVADYMADTQTRLERLNGGLMGRLTKLFYRKGWRRKSNCSGCT